jgi:UDP-2,4-diacetamido-2,4,6-trideoxy-beta-L-altropyranose hydrolase
MLCDLIIRADATHLIGSGHIMRCLSLAQRWKDEGGGVTFVTCCKSEQLKNKLIAYGFEVVFTEFPHPNTSDLRQTLSIIQAKKSPWLILDGYHFDQNYHHEIKQTGCNLMVIDDLHNHDFYYADIILNQNFNAGFIDYNSHPGTTLLLGTNYTLLRKEYIKYKSWKRFISNKVTNILVTFGGADPTDATQKTLRILCDSLLGEIDVKIIIGSENQRGETYRGMVQASNSDICLLYDVDNMSKLIEWADLAIICAGGTMWECLFMGCPTISFAVNDIQNNILQSLHRQSVIQYIGYVSQVEDADFKEELKALISSKTHRQELSANGRALIDGNGISRVLETMIGLG